MVMRPYPVPPALAELTDVDLSREDGAVAKATLRHDGAAWVGRLPTPFDGAAGETIRDIWTTISWSATANVLPSSFIAGNKVWRVTGTRPSLRSTTVDAYNLETGAQEVGFTAAPVAMMGQGTMLDGVWYGVDAGTANMYRYFTGSNVWSAALPAAPQGAGIDVQLAALRGRIHALDDATIETWDPATGAWQASVPAAAVASGAGLIAAGGYLYMAGGAGEDAGFHRYDPVAGAVTAMAALPIGLDEPRGCYLNGLIYLFGGTSGGATSDVVWVYSPTLDQWDDSGIRLPDPSRLVLGADAWNSRIVVLINTFTSWVLG